MPNVCMTCCATRWRRPDRCWSKLSWPDRKRASRPHSSNFPQETNTMQSISMLINGEAVQAANGATFERRNPLDGEVATRAPAASVADALAAVDAAATAFPAWSATGPGERRALLMRAAQVIEEKHAAFASAMAAETGASAIWAGFNVHLAASGLMEAAALTTQIAGEIIPSDIPGSLAMGVRQAA